MAPPSLGGAFFAWSPVDDACASGAAPPSGGPRWDPCGRRVHGFVAVVAPVRVATEPSCGCRIYGFVPIAVFASHFLDLWALHTRIRRIHGSCVRRVGVLLWATRARISAAQAFAFLRPCHLSAAAMYTVLWQKRHFFTFMNFSYIVLSVTFRSRAGSAVVRSGKTWKTVED